MATQAVDALEFTNLADPVMYYNPYPRYAELRAKAPVSRVKVPMMVRGTGYLLTRFDDVSALYSDERFSTNAVENGSMAKFLWAMPDTIKLLQETMVFKDDPDHKRLRTLVHKAFTPKLVMGMADDIARISAELIEQIALKRDIDMIDDFAIRLPLAVISTMLGVSDADRDKFHDWSKKISDAAGAGVIGMARTMSTSRRLLKFFAYLAQENRLHPNEGLISGLVQANDDGDKLSDREVLAMIFLLLLAGHDTTSNFISSSMLALVDHPDQLAALRADPGLMTNGVEELLRYTTPVACGTTRLALEEVEIAGVRIPKGGQAIGMIISANRDETVFPDADKLVLTREPNKHLAFAFGPHYCLGHQLARSEGSIAINQLLARFDNFEVTVPRTELRYKATPSLRGLRSLPMRVS